MTQTISFPTFKYNRDIFNNGGYMIDLKKLQTIIGGIPKIKDYPKHTIVNLFPLSVPDEAKEEGFKKIMVSVGQMIELQLEHKLPILTIALGKKTDLHNDRLLIPFCEALLKKARENKVNVTIFGRWYDLSGEVVEALKKVNNDTDDFDDFFLNICINYDGKQEITDASRVIIKKVLNEKLNEDNINPDMIKENIYSSFFIPADLVVEPMYRFSGTFLWDSVNARIYFTGKKAHEIARPDVQKALDWYVGK